MESDDIPALYSRYDRSDKYTEVPTNAWTSSEEYKSLYRFIWRVREDLNECDRLIARPNSASSLPERQFEQRSAASTRFALSRFNTTLDQYGNARQAAETCPSRVMDVELSTLRDLLHSQRSEVEACQNSLSIAIAKLNVSPTSVTQTLNVTTQIKLPLDSDKQDLAFLKARNRQYHRMRNKKPGSGGESEERIDAKSLPIDQPLLDTVETQSYIEAPSAEGMAHAGANDRPRLFELLGDTEYSERPKVAEELEKIRRDYIAYRRLPSALRTGRQRSEVYRSTIDSRDDPPRTPSETVPSSSSTVAGLGGSQQPIVVFAEPKSIHLEPTPHAKEGAQPVATSSPARDRASSLTKLEDPICTIKRRISYKPQPLPPLPRYYALNPPTSSNLPNDIATLPSQQKLEALPYPPTPTRHHTAPLPTIDPIVVPTAAPLPPIDPSVGSAAVSLPSIDPFVVSTRYDTERVGEPRVRRHTTASTLDGRVSALSLQSGPYSSQNPSSISLMTTSSQSVMTDERNNVSASRTSPYRSRLDPYEQHRDTNAKPIDNDAPSLESRNSQLYGSWAPSFHQQRPMFSLSVNDLNTYPHNSTRPSSAAASVSAYSLLPEMVSVELLRHDSDSSKTVGAMEPRPIFSPENWFDSGTPAARSEMSLVPAQPMMNSVTTRDPSGSQPTPSGTTAARRQRDRRKALLKILEEST